MPRQSSSISSRESFVDSSVITQEDIERRIRRLCLDKDIEAICRTAIQAELQNGDVATEAGISEWYLDLFSRQDQHLLNYEKPKNDDNLVSFVRPLLEPALSQLWHAISEGMDSSTVDVDSIYRGFRGWLEGKLLNLSLRCLVLELNVQRLRGLLRGASEAERFRAFVAEISGPSGALHILTEYPVLAQRLRCCTEAWLDTALMFVSRLREDLPAMYRRDEFVISGRLSRISFDLGDSHRRGSSVALLHFSENGNIVYKPRSLSLDCTFERFINWLSGKNSDLQLVSPKVWDRECYGWVEHIQARSCTSEAELRAFHQQLGVILAVFHILAGSDLHAENIIASGPNPVVVDLEALFHPTLWSARPGDRRAYLNSVLQVGLLPQTLYAGPGMDGYDISGMGAHSGQKLPYNRNRWERVGSDEMFLASRPAVMQATLNRPVCQEKLVDVLEYESDVCKGFENAYKTLLECQKELCSEDGPLSWFVGAETRVVARPTRFYGQLLEDLTHPQILRSHAEFEEYLDVLWLATKSAPSLIPLIRSERASLFRADVPLFIGKPESSTIADADTHVSSTEVIAKSGIDVSRGRAVRLSDVDMFRQVWCIRSSFAASRARTPTPHLPQYHPFSCDWSATPGDYLEEAEKIVAYLEKLGYYSESTYAWIGPGLVGEKVWALDNLGPDLYSGHAGIALMFGYWAYLTGDAKSKHIAECLVSSCVTDISTSDRFQSNVGAFSGLAGLLYVITHLGVMKEFSGFLSLGKELLVKLEGDISTDNNFDILSGSAGCIAVLAAYHAVTSDSSALELIERCGSHIVRSAIDCEHGIAWPARSPSYKPLTGFSHGAAGISWALSLAGYLIGDTRFTECSLRAIQYERSTFNKIQNNWPDYRTLERNPDATLANGEPTYCTLWCHGAPGIGMARLKMAQMHLDEEIVGEVRTAILTTQQSGFGRNHSLCHGDLGNVDFLLQAMSLENSGLSKEDVNGFMGGILRSIRLHGWLCGTPNWMQSPGYMTGLAGIAYGLMRLSSPVTVPSVLVLDPPIKSEYKV